MPKYKVIILEDYDSAEGEEAEWDLPFEFLVFDQRFDHARENGDKQRWVVRELRKDSYAVAPNPGTRQGGDPKKHRIS